MRGRMRVLLSILIMGSLLLAGCMSVDLDFKRGTAVEPHAFSGRLESGDAPEKSQAIQRALKDFHVLSVSVQQQNARASYTIQVDGMENCEAAREAIAALDFIRSRSACAPK
jgi:preprotein translocase subunit SecF